MLTGVEKRKIDIPFLALPDNRGHLDNLRPGANNNTDHTIGQITHPNQVIVSPGRRHENPETGEFIS